MLENLPELPQDKILMLMGMFRDDPRSEKVDLGVGVYRDATGLTPVFASVKAAEKLLWQTETTKSYTGLTGDPEFGDAMRQLILGNSVPGERVASAATPGSSLPSSHSRNAPPADDT